MSIGWVGNVQGVHCKRWRHVCILAAKPTPCCRCYCHCFTATATATTAAVTQGRLLPPRVFVAVAKAAVGAACCMLWRRTLWWRTLWRPHLFSLVAVVVDAQDVLVSVCCADVLHDVVDAPACGCGGGLLLWLEKVGQCFVSKVILDCVLACWRCCCRHLLGKGGRKEKVVII